MIGRKIFSNLRNCSRTIKSRKSPSKGENFNSAAKVACVAIGTEPSLINSHKSGPIVFRRFRIIPPCVAAVLLDLLCKTFSTRIASSHSSLLTSFSNKLATILLSGNDKGTVIKFALYFTLDMIKF